MEATLTLDIKRSLRFKADEFNNLRGFIILQQMNSAVEMIGMRILMECMDAVRDLEVGKTIYCVPAKSNCYWGKDLAKVNDRANYWERKTEEYADYKPNWGYAFAFNAHPKGVEFVLNIYDPTYEELVKEIGVNNVSVHSNFKTDKTTLYSLYRS